MSHAFPTPPRMKRPRVEQGGHSFRSQKGNDSKDTADVYVHHPGKAPTVSMSQKYSEYKEQASGVVMVTRFRSLRVNAVNAWEVATVDDRGLRFELFTPIKFKDAEAVCFNGKALTAAGYNTSTLAVNGQHLRDMCVANSRARFDFKNISQHTCTLEMYICSMKRDQTSSTFGFPENELNSALDMYSGNSSATLNTTLYTDPLAIKTWTDVWNVKKVKIIMEPGETASHTMQGPRKYVMDTKRHLALGNLETEPSPTWLTPSMVGNGYYVFFRMLNQITFLATNDVGTASNLFMGSRKIYPGHPINFVPSTDGSLQGGVLIKLQEYYSMKAPLGQDKVDSRNILIDFVNVTGTPIDVQIDSDQPLSTTSSAL